MKKQIEKLISKRALILAILAMAAPAIIEMGLNTILGVVDMIMIAQWGSGTFRRKLTFNPHTRSFH